MYELLIKQILIKQILFRNLHKYYLHKITTKLALIHIFLHIKSLPMQFCQLKH